MNRKPRRCQDGSYITSSEIRVILKVINVLIIVVIFGQ